MADERRLFPCKSSTSNDKGRQCCIIVCIRYPITHVLHVILLAMELPSGLITNKITRNKRKPPCLCTIKCRFNAVLFITIYHTTWARGRAMVCLLWGFWEKIDRHHPVL